MNESVCVMYEEVCGMNTKCGKRVRIEKQQTEKEQGTTVMVEENEEKEQGTARVLATEVARLPTVHLVYDGVHIRTRVDSCAGRTIVGGKLAKKVKKQPARNVAVVKAVCGTLIPIRHQTRVSVEVVEVARMKFDALVMEQCDEDLLIGADVLHAAKCIMDFGSKTITFPRATGGPVVIPYSCEPMSGSAPIEVAGLVAEPAIQSKPVVCTTQRSKTPGNSSRFDILKVDVSDGPGIFLPNVSARWCRWRQGMLWAPAVTTARNGLITVPVLNCLPTH